MNSRAKLSSRQIQTDPLPNRRLWGNLIVGRTILSVSVDSTAADRIVRPTAGGAYRHADLKPTRYRNSRLTDSLRWMRLMASPKRGATLRTCICGRI